MEAKFGNESTGKITPPHSKKARLVLDEQASFSQKNLSCGHLLEMPQKHHSYFVDFSIPKHHSYFVESSYGLKKIIGSRNSYPKGVINPAFTGMKLWEITESHEFNDYKVSPFYQIRTGIILHGTDAFIFTQISGNDIISYIKLLLRNSIDPHSGVNLNTFCKSIKSYIWSKSRLNPIPSACQIKNYFYRKFMISKSTFIDGDGTYLKLIYRMYILMYMIHYNMPLQRHFIPSKRSRAKGGWFSELSNEQQQLVLDESILISSESIPEDLIDGKTRFQTINFSDVDNLDVQNSRIFRNEEPSSNMLQKKLTQLCYEEFLKK